MLTSYEAKNDKIHIELFKNQFDDSAHYVAMAFSDDRSMGADFAFVCSPSWKSEQKVKLFKTLITKEAHYLPGNENVPQYQSATEINGQLFCKFSLDLISTVKMSNSVDRKIDFGIERYLLLATGPTVPGQLDDVQIRKHTGGRVASKEKFGIRNAKIFNLK